VFYDFITDHSMRAIVFFYLFAYSFAILNVTLSNGTVTTFFSVASNTVIKVGDPQATFPPASGPLVFETAPKALMNGSIVVLVASDPIEVHIQNVISGTSPIGLVVISAADPPGGSGYETLNEGVNYSFVEVSLFVQAQLTALAMLNGTTAYYDDTGVNEFYLFCSDLGGQIVIIAVVIVSNTVAIVFVVYAYIVKFMNVACAKLVKYIIVGMVFELIGALFRVIANIDPAGCLRVLPTSYGNIFVIAGAAFTLIDCLLMALYLHETRTLKKMKVNTWITTKTQWVFYVICAIMFAISVITALARLTEAFDMINVIAILVLAVINICIGIFFWDNIFQIVKHYNKV